MTEYLPGMEHERRKIELSQWFTGPRLAKATWEWATRYHKPRTVLEPAAGHGALVRPILEDPRGCRKVVLLDVDPEALPVLETLCSRGRQAGMAWDAECVNFLERYPSRHAIDLFDLALMNPPYEDGRAEEFILHALAVAERVVGIFKASILHGQSRDRMLWSVARATREVRLAGRPSFGQSESYGGKSDYVLLEIRRLSEGEDMRAERWVLVEHWP